MNVKRIVATLAVGLAAAVMSDATPGRETATPLAPAAPMLERQVINAGTCARNRTVVEQRACRAAQRSLGANARETKRQRRWALRKQLCRELNVRFDGSGLCW